MHDPLELSDGVINAALRAGFDAFQYGEASGYPLIALRRRSLGQPRVYLSAGIHGDEPAGPHALRRMIASGLLPQTLDYTICPLLNPAGFANGSRENPEGYDLNRDFCRFQATETRSLAAYLKTQEPFMLSACLHEDWEAQGFYLYHLGDRSDLWAAQIVDKVASIGPVDAADVIDGRPSRAGIISPTETDALALSDEWPEAYFLYSMSNHAHFTFETPTSPSLDLRIPMQIAAVTHCLDLLIADSIC